jgi:hypothetical protein
VRRAAPARRSLAPTRSARCSALTREIMPRQGTDACFRDSGPRSPHLSGATLLPPPRVRRTAPRASRCTLHAARCTFHVSRIPYHVSRITHHVSRITLHPARQPRAPRTAPRAPRPTPVRRSLAPTRSARCSALRGKTMTGQGTDACVRDSGPRSPHPLHVVRCTLHVSRIRHHAFHVSRPPLGTPRTARQHRASLAPNALFRLPAGRAYLVSWRSGNAGGRPCR